jgi:hypothetical protein
MLFNKFINSLIVYNTSQKSFTSLNIACHHIHYYTYRFRDNIDFPCLNTVLFVGFSGIE